MLDRSAINAAELRFREDLWRTAPSDAVEEAEVRFRHFGPILASVFGDLPDATSINLVQGAAERGAVEDGHLAAAIDGRDGKNYAVPLEKEDGTWKVGSVLTKEI